ncbi:MAG: tetratricopeptide repeat protein [Synergistaceae bacterium]
MDVRDVLQKFDSMLAEGLVREAGLWLEEAAESCRRSGDYAACVTLFNELEGFWRASGNREKSFAAAEAALALLVSAGLEGGIDYGTTLLNYATAKAAFGCAEEAFSLFKRVEAIYDAQLPDGDYRFASLYNNMAQSLLRTRNIDEAARYFNRSLVLLEDMEDTGDERATCCVNISFCLMAERRFEEARERLDTAEDIFNSIPDSPHRASMFAARGQLEFLLKDYAASAKYYERAAYSLEKRFGRGGSVYASACRNCAKAYESAGCEEDARLWRAAAEGAEVSRRGGR